MPPKVSICLPNLNTRPYLPERFESIFDQTFRDWELIVCDSFSDDGSWEYIQGLAAREPRMRIYQTPRKGIYAGFNDTVKLAEGEYVYIATSDDTMMPDCLEKMVAALEQNPDCGLCQCQLVIIDEKGVPFPPEKQWDSHTLGAYDPDMVLKKNKRIAPHDGLLHAALFTIYTSVTQLLIRKRVFDQIGLFDGQWGPVGDFEWEMRASLLENCIYIPDKLATWRIHPTQATQNTHSPANRLKMIDIVHTAFERAKAIRSADLEDIDIKEFAYFLERDRIEKEVKAIGGRFQKYLYLLKQFPKHAGLVVDLIQDRRENRTWETWFCANRYGRLRQMLAKYKIKLPVQVD